MNDGGIPVYTDEETPQFDGHTGEPLITRPLGEVEATSAATDSGNLSELLVSNNLMEYKADLGSVLWVCKT
jgi:hypothetical protein